MNPKIRYNFGAGPSTLPKILLEQAQAELLDWHGMGISILELGHRTPQFMQVMEEMEQDLRDLLSISAHYHVVFTSSPARGHFSMIPLNFLSKGKKGAYCVSGVWSAMAYQEASRLADVYVLARSEAPHHSTPSFEGAKALEDSAYFYFTSNETVDGNAFHQLPPVHDLPLVADMSSSLLTERVDVNDYALIFAGAQKNIAPAGLSIAIIHDDFLHRQPASVLPTVMDYRNLVAHRSLYATPPVFSCYFAGLMFKWVKAQGGVSALAKVNQRKAQKLYDFIDASDFYHAPVAKDSRSMVNCCFTLGSPDKDARFIEKALAWGLYGLKGHRLVGGLRASLYNSMPEAGVEALIDFMAEHQSVEAL